MRNKSNGRWKIEGRRSLRSAILYALSSIFVASAAGCGRLAPVEGTVRLDGKPLAAATLLFRAVSTAEGDAGFREASAMTDKDGKFRLETRSHKGALAGTYKVTVSCRILPDGVKPPENMLDAMAVEAKKVESVPSRYLSIDRTPLEVEIPAGGKKDVEIDLSTQPDSTGT